MHFVHVFAVKQRHLKVSLFLIKYVVYNTFDLFQFSSGVDLCILV